MCTLLLLGFFFFKRLHWPWLFGVRISQSLKHFEIIFWATNGSTDTDICSPAVGGYVLLRAALWRKFKILDSSPALKAGLFSFLADEQLYTLSCRCGGNYSVFKSETKDVSLVCCDTCSLVIEILQWLFQWSTLSVTNFSKTGQTSDSTC